MENFKSKLMKVVIKDDSFCGDYIARSFEEFYLQLLRPDINSFVKTLGDEKFTDIYFSTTTGHIYRIFKDNSMFNEPYSWILIDCMNSSFVYNFSYEEMYYGRVKIKKIFIFNNYYQTSEVTEIVCVNRAKLYLNIAHFPESILINNFESRLMSKKVN